VLASVGVSFEAGDVLYVRVSGRHTALSTPNPHDLPVSFLRPIPAERAPQLPTTATLLRRCVRRGGASVCMWVSACVCAQRKSGARHEAYTGWGWQRAATGGP